jgi:glucosamine 6-phosphate synthetase-like amidotransferase/phosphosugar isomerase protein
MCGIVYFHKKGIKTAGNAIIRRYEKQKERGQQGFGYVAIDLESKKLHSYERSAGEEILKSLRKLKELENSTNAILFHHRFPTSTPNIKECAHPIIVNNSQLKDVYFVVHNGIIRNCDALKLEHEELGYKYTTELEKRESWKIGDTSYLSDEKDFEYNDSESFAIELARYIEGQASLIDVEGSVAFVAIRADRDGNLKGLYYGRNHSNPLHLVQNDGEISLTSEGEWKDSVNAHTLYHYDYDTMITTEETCPIDRIISTKIDLTKKESTAIVITKADLTPSKEPMPTSREYLEGTTMTDYKIKDLIIEGMDIDTLQTEVIDEYHLVEDLLAFEQQFLANQDLLRKLEKRQSKLDDMLDELGAVTMDFYGKGDDMDYREEHYPDHYREPII